MNVREALEFAKKNRVQVVDLKFIDLIGTWQHFTIPANELSVPNRPCQFQSHRNTCR